MLSCADAICTATHPPGLAAPRRDALSSLRSLLSPPDGLAPCGIASLSPSPYLSAGWAALLSPIASDTLALPTSPPPDGLPSSEPRSVRADVIPGSERRATFATRQRGGGARRVDRGRREPFTSGRPSRGACEISRPRQPGSPASHGTVPSPPDFFSYI